MPASLALCWASALGLLGRGGVSADCSRRLCESRWQNQTFRPSDWRSSNEERKFLKHLLLYTTACAAKRRTVRPIATVEKKKSDCRIWTRKFLINLPWWWRALWEIDWRVAIVRGPASRPCRIAVPTEGRGRCCARGDSRGMGRPTLQYSGLNEGDKIIDPFIYFDFVPSALFNACNFFFRAIKVLLFSSQPLCFRAWRITGNWPATLKMWCS